MALRFYNTLSQQVEEFHPARDNTVRMYTCGPTVYDFAHIGNFRTFTFVDILRRWLGASGFRLTMAEKPAAPAAGPVPVRLTLAAKGGAREFSVSLDAAAQRP